MLLPHGTIVAVVDGRNLELYRNTGDEAEPELAAVPAPTLEAHNKGSGAHHYSSSGNPSGNQLDEDAHAAAVADWLNDQVLGHKLEKLAVIAAPKTLGEIRRHYHKQTENALIAELAKDLVGKPAAEVLAQLRDKK
ncbi:MAG: host attachment protein [Novosphingobium sp.]